MAAGGNVAIGVGEGVAPGARVSAAPGTHAATTTTTRKRRIAGPKRPGRCRSVK